MNIYFPVAIYSLWDLDSNLIHITAVARICWTLTILLLGPHHFSVKMTEFPTGNQTFYLFHFFLYPHLLNFSHRRNLVAKFEVSSLSWNRISTVLESDLTKTAAYQTQSSMVHKKHIWYLHPNPGYIKSITL